MLLASLGLVPREVILFWTGIAVFYIIFSPLEDSLWLVVASIPFFAALPVADSFDTLASWRILVLILFLCMFFKKGITVNLFKNSEGKIRLRENLKHYAVEYLSLIFLAIALLSFFIAPHKILALKKFIFLINIAVLFLIVRNLARDRRSIVKVWQAAAVGAIASVAVAVFQFLAVLVWPLINFWQFWASKTIPALYGEKLGELLSYSNTWFAYYRSAPPTLRLFSVFPDSHSFAMFSILSVPIFLGLAWYYKNKRAIKNCFWVLTGLALSGAVLSGSRGAWLSIVPVIAVALYIRSKKIDLIFAKKALFSLFLFIFIFIASFGYPPLLYTFQAWQTGQDISSSLNFFERARSISDFDELSNKGRLEIWQASAKSILQKPLLGVGLGNYFEVLNEDASTAKKGSSAHNLYLDFASEIGIFGAVAIILMFGNILYSAWLVFRHAREEYFKLFGLLFCLYFLWIAAYSFFDVVLLNDKVLLFFMVGAAALYNIRNLEMEPQRMAEPSPFIIKDSFK